MSKKKKAAEGEAPKKGGKKKKLMIAIPLVLLLVAGVGYKKFMAPKPKVVPPKIAGQLVSLGNDFVINLAGGHYGKVSVAVLLEPAPAAPAAAGASSDPAAAAQALLPQYDAVRSIVTDDLTGVDQSQLIQRNARHELLQRLLTDIKKSTDEPVTRVLITDLAVQ